MWAHVKKYIFFRLFLRTCCSRKLTDNRFHISNHINAEMSGSGKSELVMRFSKRFQLRRLVITAIGFVFLCTSGKTYVNARYPV